MLKSLDNKKNTQYQNVLFLSGSLGALGLALYTLHDLQTAEGAGLYLSILYGQANRTPFDVLVDIMGMLLLLALLLLPCLLLKHLRLASFFRLLSVYLAIMPIVHPGNAVHLSSALLDLSLRENLLKGNLLEILFTDCVPAFELLKFILPFLLLLLAINRAQSITGFQKARFFFPCIIIVFVLYLLFDGIAEIALYLLYYLLLIWSFAEWEAACKHSTRFANWSLIIFVGCLLRGIYRMLELISHTHL